MSDSSSYLDSLELLRKYVSENKMYQTTVSDLNKVLHCAVNQDGDIEPVINRWENFWLMLDSIAVPDFVGYEHIVEDAVDFASTDLQFEFVPGEKLSELLDRLLDITQKSLSLFSPACVLFNTMPSLIEFTNSNQSIKIQINRILFSLNCYAKLDDEFDEFGILRFFFNSMSSLDWWKKNVTFDSISPKVVEYWNSIYTDKELPWIWIKLIKDAQNVIAKFKSKVDDDSCAQKLIEFSESENDKDITPTP